MAHHTVPLPVFATARRRWYAIIVAIMRMFAAAAADAIFDADVISLRYAADWAMPPACGAARGHCYADAIPCWFIDIYSLSSILSRVVIRYFHLLTLFHYNRDCSLFSLIFERHYYFILHYWIWLWPPISLLPLPYTMIASLPLFIIIISFSTYYAITSILHITAIIVDGWYYGHWLH